MKKKPVSLTLHRETLRHLVDLEMRTVHGGEWPDLTRSCFICTVFCETDWCPKTLRTVTCGTAVEQIE
jgi:hypothetical protein